MKKIKFTTTRPHCDRRHYITEDDVHVLLSRLPSETYSRLRHVHFNDQSRGVRKLGYVNMGHREIAVCALPPRVSLTRFLVRGQSPAEFGAKRGAQWTEEAVRRFMLYDVFLHELGHLQLVRPESEEPRRRFAMEKLAQEFADGWRSSLWSQPFEHADPIHNPPKEISALAPRHWPRLKAKEVMRLARQAARDTGRNLADYTEEPKPCFEFVHKNWAWTVLFNYRLPKPRNHFVVWVDDRTLQTRVDDWRVAYSEFYGDDDLTKR